MRGRATIDQNALQLLPPMWVVARPHDVSDEQNLEYKSRQNFPSTNRVKEVKTYLTPLGKRVRSIPWN